MNAKDSLGMEGERAAERFLRAQGLRIVARRWRTRAGEIDLIALDGDEVVFVEVKARRGDAFGAPEEAVTRAKRAHLRPAAVEYLRAKGLARRPYRIDVVAVSPEGVSHFPSAVGEEG